VTRLPSMKQRLKMAVIQNLAKAGYVIQRHPDAKPATYPEATPEEMALVRKYKPYTMTGNQRQWTLLKALHYVDANGIDGDIVECGVWRGGNMMMLAEASASSQRTLWLYDTFEGMPEASDFDVNTLGQTGEDRRREDSEWCLASRPEVESNFKRHGLMSDRIVFRQGMVEDTLKNEPLPERIAILRLDTDFYESTKIELELLYPLLAPGGVLIIDDYGLWQGSKKAVDEYFADRLPLLVPVDYTARYAIKV
jgi:O-methyltransferase